MINNKKKTFIVISVAIVIMVIIILIFINNNNKNKNQPSTIIKDGKSDSDVIVDKITFSNITKVYDGGITTITADMVNNTTENKNFKLEIILKDEDGKEVKSAIQVVENLEPDRKKKLTTGIAGNYTNIKEVEFKVMEDE